MTSLPTFDPSITLAQTTDRSPIDESTIWLPALITESRPIFVMPRRMTFGSMVTSGLDLDGRVDDHRGGVVEGHALFHVALDDGELEHELDLSEVRAVVDAGELAFPVGVVGRLDGNHGARAVCGGDLDQLRQVQLAGGRARRQLRERGAQPRGVERVQTGIDERDLVFVRRRVLEFDDPFDATRRVRDHSAVMCRIVQLDGGQCHLCSARTTRVEQLAHRIRLDQRNVAG